MKGLVKMTLQKFQKLKSTVKGNYGEQMIYKRMKANNYIVRIDPEPTASNFDIIYQDENVLERLEVKVAEYQKREPYKDMTGINLKSEEDYLKVKEPLLLIFVDRSTRNIYGNYFKHLTQFRMDLPGINGPKVMYPISEMKPISTWLQGFNDSITIPELNDFKLIDDSYHESQEPPIYEKDLLKLANKLFNRVYILRYQ